VAQNKGWDLTDPVKALAAAAQAYQGAQRLIGLPPDKVLRIPEPSAPPAEIAAFHQRLGVPKEAGEYDLTAVKFAGEPLEADFVETLRTAFHANRVPKDSAAPIAAAVARWFEEQDSAETAARTNRTNEQVAALKKNWGNNYDVNMVVAKTAFTRLAQAAGLDEASAKEAVDAISGLGGLGGATVMEMLRVAGSRMGEDRFVSMPRAGGGDGLPMTQQAAAAEIESLKHDKAFISKYLNGDVAAKERMNALHKIATGANTAAA
jgi:hypothetical protein